MKALFIYRVLDGTSVGRIPLGILYLSAALKRAGHQTDLVDGCNVNHVIDHVRRSGPDVLLYSAHSSFHQAYLDLNRQLKQEFPHLRSIIGGAHATFFPSMINEDGIDIVCRGEGEEALPDLLNRMERGEDFTRTPNMWVKQDGEIIENDVRPFVEDIDSIAFPDRALLDRYPSVRNFRSRNFISSRGCPFNCSYCFNRPFFEDIYKKKGTRVRKRSVDNLLEEIEREKLDHPFDLVQFEDDIFIYKLEWLEEFRDKYIKRVGLPFICNMRVELFNDDVARLLKESGCNAIWFGLETGNEKLLRKLLNRKLSHTRTIAAVESAKRHGIRCTLELMIGLPTTTLDNDLETLDLCVKCGPTFANAHIFTPFPGLELTRVAIDADEFEGDFDAIEDVYDQTSLKHDHHRELNNLVHLLSLSVRFPALRKFTPLLLRLPLSSVYGLLNRIYKGYTISTKLLPMKPNRYFPLYAFRKMFR